MITIPQARFVDYPLERDRRSTVPAADCAGETSMELVEIRQVVKRFAGIEVLKGLDLDVDEHQAVCLIGPSGCGKSTLLRCINGLEDIQGGEIRLHGDRVTGPGVDLNALRRDVGIVFQSVNLFSHMTVLANVTLARSKCCDCRGRGEARAMILLRRIGLEHKASDYPDRLSGGQQQRVAIVRALAMEPMVLLLDEITWRSILSSWPRC